MEHPTWQRRFDHDAWANQRVLDALAGVDRLYSDESAVLAHVFGAERLWHARLLGEPTTNLAVHPEPTRPFLEAQIEELPRLWEAYLEPLGPEDLTRTVAYTNSKGTPYESPIGEILHHVLMHGSHHRGQITSSLRRQGVDPPALDFIVFQRGDASDR